MIRPGRLAAPDASLRIHCVDKVGGHAQGSVTPGTCSVTARPAYGSSSPNIMFERGRHIRRRLDAQVGLAGFAIDQPALRLLHTAQHGCRTRSVLVHADSQVNLVRVGVLLKGLRQTEDRIGRSGLYGLEHFDSNFHSRADRNSSRYVGWTPFTQREGICAAYASPEFDHRRQRPCSAAP